MIVSLAVYARPLEPLFLRQQRQQPKHHWTPGIQLHLHETMAHRVRDVFKMHRRALDQRAHGNDRIKRSLAPAARSRRSTGGRGLGQVRGRRGQEVGRRGDQSGRDARLRL